MLNCYLTSSDQKPIPVCPLTTNELSDWVHSQDGRVAEWIASTNFSAKAGSLSLIPGSNGQLEQVLFGIANHDDFWTLGDLPNVLPKGIYSLVLPASCDSFRSHLAWGLGAYRFSNYRDALNSEAKLVLPASFDASYLENWAQTIYQLRDWINTPAEDMTPPVLADNVKQLGKTFSAKVNILSGNKLLKAGYRAIHTVGRASEYPPCLIDLRWGPSNAPKVTLVGKGVCFDTGGLDIKIQGYMRLMKKDMSGAAHAIGLARMIMSQNLPVCLRLLVPAVENSVGSNSYRPGDVIKTHAGVSVEVENTDCEGRLVLCDALSEAVTEQPDCLIDFSTLTGSARVALGPEIPAFFSNNEDVAAKLINASFRERDLLWRLPLHKPYEAFLKSHVADINSAGSVPHAGAITAALFLQRFVPKEIPWVHFDMSAWNFEAKPGRPVGAEVMALRAVFSYLREQYGN